MSTTSSSTDTINDPIVDLDSALKSKDREMIDTCVESIKRSLEYMKGDPYQERIGLIVRKIIRNNDSSIYEMLYKKFSDSPEMSFDIFQESIEHLLRCKNSEMYVVWQGKVEDSYKYSDIPTEIDTVESYVRNKKVFSNQIEEALDLFSPSDEMCFLHNFDLVMGALQFESTDIEEMLIAKFPNIHVKLFAYLVSKLDDPSDFLNYLTEQTSLYSKDSKPHYQAIINMIEDEYILEKGIIKINIYIRELGKMVTIFAVEDIEVLREIRSMMYERIKHIDSETEFSIDETSDRE
jgi:hypothetical protein